MAEVLFEYQSLLSTSDGTVYRARACGKEDADGLWEAWIEFVPIGGGKVLRSPRETTQPNRTDTMYWATGLTPVYLEGAFNRATNPLVVAARTPPETPAFDRPAPAYEVRVPVALKPDAVLDPFSVYEKGEALLRQELSALAPWHLVNIIRAYDLSTEDPETLGQLSHETLSDLIVLSVRRRIKAVTAK
jgi:hypothetical protein